MTDIYIRPRYTTYVGTLAKDALTKLMTGTPYDELTKHEDQALLEVLTSITTVLNNRENREMIEQLRKLRS